MNLFHPRTFSTDWEVMVLDRLDRALDMQKLSAFAGLLSRESDHPIQLDWNTLEFALGINASFAQIWERIRRVTDRAAQVVREFDCDLFPAGAHPTDEMFNSSHIHVGTIHDESAAIRLETSLLRYAPAFAALAANSPLASGRRSEFKSYRVQHEAHGCTRPNPLRDPALAQPIWGTDTCPKLAGAPTLEIRITDCASSRRFLAELATFVAAFVHHLGTHVPEDRPAPRAYQDSLTNRWLAARHGLQATFTWEARARPVADILDEMLDECREELAALGVRRSDLTLVEKMRTKRICQADFVIGLAERYPDPACLTSAYAKLMRHWTVFDEWLETAPALDPTPLPDDDAILAEHLALIGEGTHFYQSREAMHYPPPVADAVIERLIEQGLVTREITERHGVRLSRLRSPE
ncbi:MAG: hypothetical protein JO250_24365 [Armatimonadetes bacterium]|nr:hypothetical protein [Armatimonadota bacterium]